jgi:4-hydroxy-tetrahydrodipicolinate synthase
MKSPVFKGLCTALVTPFKNGTIDKMKLEQLLELQIEGGAAAVVVCGTTGEASTLSTHEQIEMIAHSVKYAAGRIKIIAGTGSNDTAHCLEMSRVACSLGADGILIVTPYYNKTTQIGLIDHYLTIADGITCPMILYNVPSRTGLNIAVDTYVELSKHPLINGVKESCGDISKIQRILQQCGDEFFVWSGNDDQIVPMIAVGAIGAISVISNIMTKDISRLIELCQLQDYRTAGWEQCRLMPIIDQLFVEVNPIPIKAAMNMLGYNVGSPRKPLHNMTSHAAEKLQLLLEEFHAPVCRA